MNREAGAQIFDLRDVPAAFIAALEHQNPAFTVVPMNLEKELDLETFMNGLDSHWHSPESRRSWCRMFFADMQRRGGAIRG